MARSHHITSLSLNGDGWITYGTSKNHQADEDSSKHPIEIIPSCQRLLKEMNLDLSSACCDSLPDDGGKDDGPGGIPLDELRHRPGLANSILKVIASIRRLGGPGNRDQRRNAEEEGGRGRQKNQNGTSSRGRNNNRRGGRGVNGKVARMEEQMKLRHRQEQQKLLLQEQSRKIDKREQDEENEVTREENDEENEDPDDGEGFVVIGETNEDSPGDAAGEIPVEKRLPAVFNSIRLLITVVRPMLDHPQCEDTNIKMKNGPSLNPGNKKEGKNHRNYLLSKHVYARVSAKSWNELRREYHRLLDETQGGLSAAMSKLNDDGRYELNAKDWVAGLFDHDVFTNRDLVAKRCMELPTLDPGSVGDSGAALKLHEALIDRFENDHDEMQYLLQRSIRRLQDTLMAAISRRFNGVRLTVYGSCLSNLALEGSHDVDVSIYIPELDGMRRSFEIGRVSAAQYEKKMRRIIYQVRDSLQYYPSESFFDLNAVARARVPVIKGTLCAQNPYTEDGSLSFDLCFLNEIAVVNSNLLREYSLFGNHVRILMLSVKSFAKANGIASAADGTLSSYSWLNMVVFYLQCVGMLPSLQCPKLMQEHGFKPDSKNPWHCVNGLDTCYYSKAMMAKKSTWKCSSDVNDTETSMLLYGFFNFYSSVFPTQTVAASIRIGEISLQKTSLHQTCRLWRLCIEDPFETCTSHCPHDLGCHVKEDGQQRINEHLVRAAKEIEALMQEDMPSNDAISVFLSRLLGPARKSNVKNMRGRAGNAQLAHRPKNDHRDRARNHTAHHYNRNSGNGHGRNMNNMQSQSNAKVPYKKHQNATSTSLSAKSQMKSDSGGGRDAMQKKNWQKGKQTQNIHDNHHAKSTQSVNHSQAVDPANNKRFMKKQKERLNQISEKKTQKDGKDAESGKKLDKSSEIKGNQHSERHQQKVQPKKKMQEI